ncbi:MAG: ATP synthase F0 subunit B [Planctomycetaceae bacterium]
MFVLLAGAALFALQSVCLAVDAHATGEPGEWNMAEDLPFWGIVAFVGFLIALKLLGWKPFVAGMRDREETTRALLADADRVHREAQAKLREQKGQMEAIDEQIREVLAEAERDAAHTRSEIRIAADREAAIAQERAELEISRTRDQSLHSIFETLAGELANRTEQRLRDSMSGDRQDRLVSAALAEFASRHK